MNTNTVIVVKRGSGGIGFLGALTLVFITLKLCGVIDWSWLGVLAPLWVPVVAVLLFAGVCFGVVFVVLGAMMLIAWASQRPQRILINRQKPNCER